MSQRVYIVRPAIFAPVLLALVSVILSLFVGFTAPASSPDYQRLLLSILPFAHPSGIYYNRQFDWPTGEAIGIDVPVWVVDMGLLVLTLVAFGCYVRSRLHHGHERV